MHRLLPWLTVKENVGLGMEGKKSYIRDRVRHYLEKVGLSEFENTYPNQLSGGMAQRVSIARYRTSVINAFHETIGMYQI